MNKKKISILLSALMVVTAVSTIPARKVKAADLNSSLILKYDFDETSGTTVNDSSGNGNNGTIEYTTTPASIWVDGKNKGAINLTGDDVVKLPDNITNNLTDFTITTWASQSTVSAWQRLFDLGESKSACLWLTLSNGGNSMFSLTANGSYQEFKAGQVNSPNTWRHVAVSKSGSTVILYVDGAEVGRKTDVTLTPSDLGNTTNNYIGKSKYPDPKFNGKVDDFRIYNKGLSSDEIQSIVGQALTDGDIVDIAKSNLTLGDTSNVKSNLMLPTEAANGVTISWISDSQYVTSAGVVTFPAAGAGDQTVTLTANLVKNNETRTKTFTVKVLEANKIDSVRPFEVSTLPNVQPQLPATVAVHYTNGDSGKANVTWDAIPADKLTTTGSITVDGTIDGTTLKATAYVQVTKDPSVQSFDPVTVTTNVNEQPTLPKTVTAHYADNSTAQLDVKWDAIPADKLGKDGTITVNGTVNTMKYTNPLIMYRADPQIYKHTDGYYYFTASYMDNDHNNVADYQYDRIVLRRSKTIEGLSTAPEVTIWTKHKTGEMGSHIWAPELHYIDGKWYIYFAAGTAEDVWAIRPYVLECEDADPMNGTWVEKGMVQKPAGDTHSFNNFSLDMTTFENNGKRYFVWAQKDGGNSNLYIAEAENPWTIKDKGVLISTPDYDWEKQYYYVNEGPSILKRNGRIFLAYSASATDWRYCLGMLTASDTSDLLDPSSWEKSDSPVFATNEAAGQYGPGHNSFTTSEDGNADIMVYHAREEKIQLSSTYDPLNDAGRLTRVQQVNWNTDGTPNFGVPVADGDTFATTKVTATVNVGQSTIPTTDFTVKSSFNLNKLEANTLLDVKTTVTNNKSSQPNVLAIVALYDEKDKMVNMSYISKNIAVGKTENLNSGFKLPANIANYKVKVFVWDGANFTSTNMQPLSNMVTLQ